MPANRSAIFAGWSVLGAAPVSAMSIGSLCQLAHCSDGRTEQGSKLPGRFVVVAVQAHPGHEPACRATKEPVGNAAAPDA